MHRRLALSLVDQALVSAFNFLLNLYLIRLWSPEQFGIFAIVVASSILAAMLQNAAINTPLSVHLPILAETADKARLRRVFAAANLLLTACLLLLACAGMLVWQGQAQILLVTGASAYLCTQFLREYQRSLLAVEGRLASLLTADFIYVLLSAGGLLYLHRSAPSLGPVLLLLAMAGLISVGAHFVPRRFPSLRSLPAEMRAVFGEQRHEIRWSLLGVITTDIQNRAYIFVAAAVFGPATVAQLQAARLFFGPLNLITGAWARIARPQLAAWLAKGDETAFNTQLRRALSAFIAFNVLFLAALWLVWPYLSSFVFGDKYAGLELLVLGWGIANIAFQARSCLGIGVQARRRFRELTLATIYGAVVSALIVAAACLADAPFWLVASVIGGETVAIATLGLQYRRRRAPAGAASLSAPSCPARQA